MDRNLAIAQLIGPKIYMCQFFHLGIFTKSPSDAKDLYQSYLTGKLPQETFDHYFKIGDLIQDFLIALFTARIKNAKIPLKTDLIRVLVYSGGKIKLKKVKIFVAKDARFNKYKTEIAQLWTNYVTHQIKPELIHLVRADMILKLLNKYK